MARRTVKLPINVMCMDKNYPQDGFVLHASAAVVCVAGATAKYLADEFGYKVRLELASGEDPNSMLAQMVADVNCNLERLNR